jgi:hypothetical protein
MAKEYERKGFEKNTETHKWCPKCERLLERATNYYKNKARHDGLDTTCKECYKLARQKRLQTKEGKEKHRAYSAKWREENREKSNKYSREWCKNNREKVREYVREGQRKLMRERRKDPVFRLRCNVSRQIGHALKRANGSKRGESVMKHLPYTQEQLREHLEKQFDDNMTWENYGTYWHIDHIYPQSLLPYDSMEHPNFQKCWSLDNLQPLEGKANIRKSNKLEKVIDREKN